MSHQLLIQRLTDDFVASDSHWHIRGIAAQHKFLPLYVGWFSIIGIQADSVFVRFDDDYDRISPLRNGVWQRMAICQGIIRYPVLSFLRPKRPWFALTCSGCKGTGTGPGVTAGGASLICECGGVGWRLPFEDKSQSPG